MSIRDDLADAASTVDGLTGHPYYVQTTNPGTVLVRLDRVEYPNRFGGVAHWALVLVGPQDAASAEHYFEEKLPPLREAVGMHLAVTSVTPSLVDFGAGAIPCAVISGHREE